MSEKFTNLNLKDDAEVKYTKLCEIVKNIEINGQEGDQFPRQVVFKAIIESDNEYLWKMLPDKLFENGQSELMKTVLLGFFMQKKITEPIYKYANNVLNELTIIDEQYEEQESLLLLADALVKCVEVEGDEGLKSLLQLYKASCLPDSTAIMADHLLQRFINILPNKSKLINEKLLELILNTDSEINSRIISINILSHSIPVEFSEIAENIITNISEFSRNNIEKIYLLDVLTKYVYNAAVSSFGITFKNLNTILNNYDMDKILLDAKAEHGSDNEHLDVLYRRVIKRITQFNEHCFSQN